MPITPAELPDDVAELKRIVVAKIAELEAAKNGLLVTQLTIEKLKAQIAKFRREKFGASSERMERVIAQLELALEEAETAKGEITAPAEATAELEAMSDARTEQAKTPDAPAVAKKKRRTLPPELPRRDVVHQPDGVCKGCGGTDLRTARCLMENVTEQLAALTGLAPLDLAGGVPWRGRSAWRHDAR